MRNLTTTMLLRKLIKNSKITKKIAIRGLTSNSNSVRKGFVFFALKGHNFNGEKFINVAIKKGAVAIVCSRNCKYTNKTIPVIKSSNIRYLLSKTSSNFFKLKPKNLIAVTGTNGKTSVADYFYQILTLSKIPVASIGTLGIKFKGKIIKTNLTTPDTVFLHQTLEKLKKENIENVIIEASSHGLHQKRLDHINFKAGIFTNLSQDHLDYHKTMRSYFNAKLILLNNILSKKKIVITDKSINQFPEIKKISKKNQLKLIEISKIENKLKRKSKLNFNFIQLKNISMAIAAAKLCNISENKIFKNLKKIKDVNGRLELVKTFSKNIKVYIDFAHTPEALLKSLQILRKYQNDNISLVFGCGGDRDFKKRPLMAKIASDNCKRIYVTDDNPRNEKPEKIRNEILEKISNKNCFNIGNRTTAIKTAIKNADPNEIILVAGKGHETEQIYKKKSFKISDKKIIKNLKIKKISNKSKNFDQNKNIFKEIHSTSGVKNFHGLAIDSRVVKKDNLFLTIRGKNNNGVRFISQALQRGAKNILSSKKIEKNKNKIIKVNNEIEFLNNFAYKKRDNTNSKIIAITGSAGKTSLKNLVKYLLQSFGKTFCSPKSYNNHFGVPLSLSNLSIDHKYGVFEVGMSKAGEINKLSKLIRPHIAIITNIGEAHIENFKNLKGIAEAKSEIMNNIERGGAIILNRDDKFFKYLEKKAKLKKIKVVSFGLSKKADIHPINKSTINNKNLSIRINQEILKIDFKYANIYNVLSSIALLKILKLNTKRIIKSFKNFEPSDGRGRVHKIKRYNKHFKLIDESYNANPLSVKTAINNFKSIKKQNLKKYLLLGDMLELGKKSEKLHHDLSKVINNSDIDKVFIKGNKTLLTYKNLHKEKRGNIFQHEEDVDFTLNNIIANNDYLMIKGSNATGLNNFSKKLIKGS